MNREDILARADEREGHLEPVHVPDWGDEPVYIRVLGAKEALAISDGDADALPFAILVATVCAEDGTPIFRPGDEDVLSRLALREISPLFRKSATLNGLTEEAVEEAVARFGQAPDESTSSE